MSILKVDNIRDNGSGFNDVVSFQNVNGTENGRLCRAFVNFNGQGVVAARANFNVNSITDNGTGDFTVNFSNALSDANYCVSGSCVGSTANYFNHIFGGTNASLTSSSVRFMAANSTNPNVLQDSDFNHICCHR